MSRWLPEVAEERWIALAGRYPELAATPTARSGAGGWNTARPLSRVGFFLLGLFAGTQTQSLLSLLLGFDLGLAAGLITLLVAEVLIVRRRLFRSGLEEGLWLAGLSSICSAFLPRLIEHHEALALALPSLTLILAGLRLLNPLALVAGALLSSASVSATLGHPWMAPGTGVASLYCLALALFALFLGGRSFRRPSFDRMLDYLVIAMPVAAFGWALVASPGAFRLQALAGPWYPHLLPVLVPLVCAGACFIAGLRRRTHAPLLAVLLCKLCLVYELREITGLPLRWRLLLWGTLALLACLALDRWLRKPRNGITTAEVGDDAESPLFPDIARASLLTPHHAPSSPAPYQGGGGQSGGGGASGQF